MKRTIVILLAGCISFLGCDTPATTDGPDSTGNASPQSSTLSIDNKFVGSCKYFGYIPDDNSSDHSMDGIICELEKYKDTKKTYVFHLYTGNDLILSIRNDSTLTGENADMTVRYSEPSGHLILRISPKSRIVFAKLQ